MNTTRRLSRGKTRRRSQSPSPLRGRVGKLTAPDLLAHSISILASIVAEDCRFQVTAPRPSRPPNALQSVALDAAGYLLHMNRHNPKVASQIGFALLPAFYTFRPEMHTKLLTFFDTMVIRPMLESLREAQGNLLAEGVSSQIPTSLSRTDNISQPLQGTSIQTCRSSKSTSKRLGISPRHLRICAGDLGPPYHRNPRTPHPAMPLLKIL